MKLLPLAPESRMYHLATHKVIVEYTDLTALSGAGPTAVQIFPGTGKTVPAGTTVRFAGFNLITAFNSSDASTNSLLCEVGDGVDPNRYLLSTQIHEDGTEVLFQDANAATQPYTYEAADAIDALLTVAGGTPLFSELNAGKIEFYFHISNKNDLERAV